MRVIRQDPEHHYVDLDDPFEVLAPIVSVTQALGTLPEYREAYRFSNARALSLGSAVHGACEIEATGRTIDPASLDPAVVPFLEAWRRCRRDMGLIIRGSEVLVFHPTLRYAGTLDILATRGGGKLITDLGDIKTGSPSQGARLAGPQTAAYLQGLRLHPRVGPALAPAIRRWSAHLAKDGSYRVVPHTQWGDDWFRFTEALKTWRIEWTTRLA